MFTLILDKSKFYKVKSHQSRREIEELFSVPVGEVFVGKIITLGEKYQTYIVKPLETYEDIAKKFCVDERLLRERNSDKILYPTAKIFIPFEKNQTNI